MQLDYHILTADRTESRYRRVTLLNHCSLLHLEFTKDQRSKLPYLLHNRSIEAFLTHPLPARVTAIDDKTRPNGALHAKAKVDLWSLVFDLWSFVSNSLVARADHDFGEETDDALYSSKDQKRSKTKDHPIDDRVSARVRVELRFRWPTEKTHESMKGVRAASNYTWKTSNRTDLGSPPLSIS